MTIEGVLKKMQTTYAIPVEYKLFLIDQPLVMSELLGATLQLTHMGYECLNCMQEKEIYRQGMCKKCFFESPAVGAWVMHPELSKAHLGIADRDLAYEQEAQLQPHVIYLANSSDVKVGVTRLSQTPTRWIDQGAHQALPIAQVPNRYLAGIGEVALKAHVSDKTAWRKMLTNTLKEIDLCLVKTTLIKHLPHQLQPYVLSQASLVNIIYPVHKYPSKVNSLNLQKTPIFTGKLVGIKGQYLIFDNNTVFNVRSHEGFKVALSF